jgi:hypothetical protein
MQSEFAITAPVLVLSLMELRSAALGNPFPEVGGEAEGGRLHLHFLAQEPVRAGHGPQLAHGLRSAGARGRRARGLTGSRHFPARTSQLDQCQPSTTMARTQSRGR